LFELSVEDLRRHCAAADKQVPFTLFERYDLDGPEAAERPTYAHLGGEFGIQETQVTNYLAYARRQFRRFLLERLRATTGRRGRIRGGVPALARRRRAVKYLSDTVVAHLRTVAVWPDLSGTRYELAEPIGRGGMGTVYRARDRSLDRPVAIKVLHDLPEGVQAEPRLVREARLTARLEHPGIVPVHDAGVLPDGRFYYVMKLVRGKRLDEPAAFGRPD